LKKNKEGKKMKKLWVTTLMVLWISATGYAGDGDVLINGKLGLRTDAPTGVFEIVGQINGSILDAIPTMTSNTTPSGIASASSNWSVDYGAWRAMDHSNADQYCWHSGPSNTFPHWLQYQFPSGKTITSYTVTSRNSTGTGRPTTWNLQGSNNGSSWTNLDTETGQSFGSNEKKTFSFANSISYAYYRLYITAGDNSQYAAVGELELMEAAGTQTVSLFYVDEVTGHVGIWGNNPGNYNLYVNGTMFASSYSNSDMRWKKSVTPIDNALSLIERLQGVRFEWRSEEYQDKHFEKGVQVGMIAQEVEQVLPEIVKADQDGSKAISYEKLTAVLVEALKEQNKKIKELEAKIDKNNGK
jgi:hypothetical protein